MKQEIWTQMCPLSPYLLPWPDCCTVAVYGQTKTRKSRVFIPVNAVHRFLGRGRIAFQIIFRFLRFISSNSILSMNYLVINVSAFLNCCIAIVSIFVIFYFVIQKIIM